MSHIKTNKTLHLTEILTHLKSFNNYIHSTEGKPSQTSSFFRNNWFLGLNSIISLQRLPRTTLFKLICRVYAVDSANIGARQPVLVWNFLGCMEFTDWLLANQISWDPVCTSWSLITPFIGRLSLESRSGWFFEWTRWHSNGLLNTYSTKISAQLHFEHEKTWRASGK